MIKGTEIVYQGQKLKFIYEAEYKQPVDTRLELKSIIPVAIRYQDSNGKDQSCNHIIIADGQSLFTHDWKEPWKCKSTSCQNSAKGIQDILFFKQLYILRSEFHASKQYFSYIRGLAFFCPIKKQEYDLLKEMKADQYVFMELFYQIYQSSKNTLCLKRILEDYKQDEILDTKCLISNLPTKIPVRHRSCQHFDCYDLFSLVLLQKQRSYQNLAVQFKCYLKGCNVIYDITTFDKMKQDLFLDLELFQVLNKSPLYYTLFSKDKNGQLQPYRKCYEICYQKFINNNSFEQISKQEEKYQRFFNVICSQELNQKVFKSINYVQSDIFTNQRIEFPTKCKQCRDDVYLDLLTFIFHLLNQINEDFILNNRDKGEELKATCPSCGNFYLDSKNQSIRAIQVSSLQFYQNIIINTHLLRAIRGLQQKVLNISGEVSFLNYFQNQLCLQDSESIEILFKDRQIINSCVVTTKQLVNPLLLIKCPERNHIEFEEFFKLYSNLRDKETLILCKCQRCIQDPNQNQSIESSLLFNQFFFDKLKGGSKQKKYNLDGQELQETPRIESVQEKIISQNPQIGSIRYQKNFMVDEIKYQGFKIKEVSTNFGNFSEKGTQLGYQSNIDKAAEQAQQSANKYGFKVKSVNVHTNLAPDIQRFKLN